jgi:exopolysaccharide production protein ExoF
VSQNLQPIGAGSEPDETGNLGPPGSRGSVRALRRPSMGVIALSLSALALGALGVGAMRISPAGSADALEGLSAAWAHLRGDRERAGVVVETRFNPEPLSLAGPTPPAASQSAIAYGDRLKVTFFESLSVALGDSARKPDTQAINSIFPRMDLSGDYQVDEAGGVDIPRLGRFAATGHGVGALEAQLSDAFRRALGRPSDVHVAIVDRQPVYVLGGPRGGATIKHAPGMIVLQVLAEAGGYQRDASDISRTIEIIRETQRLGDARDRLARALVRQARLIALRDDLSTVVLPAATASRLAKMLSQDAIAALLRDADAMLKVERQAYSDRRALADRLVDITKAELAAQNLRVTQARALGQNKAARLRDFEAIAARGSVSQFKVNDMAIDVAEVAAKQEDLLVAVAQADARLAEAEMAHAKILQSDTAQIALDLTAIEQEVSDLDRAVTSMQAVVAVLGNGQTVLAEGQANPRVLRIVRRGPSGTLLIPAVETTLLMPGDVLQLDPAEPSSRPVTASANP